MPESIRDANSSVTLRINSDGSIIVDSTSLTQALENDSSGKAIYIGEALPGTAKSAEGWRIKKLTYDGNYIIDVQWASGNSLMDKKWTLRADYVYS